MGHLRPSFQSFPWILVGVVEGAWMTRRLPKLCGPQGFHTCLSSIFSLQQLNGYFSSTLLIGVQWYPHLVSTSRSLFLCRHYLFLSLGPVACSVTSSSLLVCTKFDVNPGYFPCKDERDVPSSPLHHKAKPFPFILMVKLYYVKWMCDISYLTNFNPILFYR